MLDSDTAPVVDETPVAAAPAADETPVIADPAAEPEPAQEPEAVVQERDEAGKFKKPATEEIPAGAQKSIDKAIAQAVRARRESERLNTQLEARLRKLEEATPPAPNTPPKTQAPVGQPKPVLTVPRIEDFEYDTEKHEAAKSAALADHLDKLSDWKLDQRDLAQQAKTAREQSQQTAQTIDQRLAALVAAGNEEFDDFDELVSRAPNDGGPTITSEMRDMILESPVGVQMAYRLASDVKESVRIANLSPVAQGRELAKLEASLTPAPKPPAEKKPARAALPKPPVVVGTPGSPAEIDLDTADMRSFGRQVRSMLNPR